MRILIAEDDRGSAAILEFALQRAGHTVTLARSGFDALRRVQHGDVDMLITDWLMPDMDGIELVHNLRLQQTRHIPVLVVSALASESAREFAQEAGADGYLSKPCTPQQVIAAIESLTSPAPEITPEPEAPVSAAPSQEDSRAADDGWVRESLFPEYAPVIRRMIRRQTTDAERGQDLEGEAYCVFNGLLKSFDPARGVPFRPYVINHLSLKLNTLQYRQYQKSVREALLEPEVEGEIVDPHNDIEALSERLERQEAVDALRETLQLLPERQRNIVKWRYLENRSFEAIADELGVTQATVRSLLRCGLNTLRKRMADGAGGK